MARSFSQPIRIENSYLEFTNPSGKVPNVAPSGKSWMFFNPATGSLMLSVSGGAFGEVEASGALGDTLTLGGDVTLSRAAAGILQIPQVRIAGTPPAATTDSLLRMGTALVGGSASGAYIGINVPAAFSGDQVTLQKDDSTRFRILSDGTMRIGTAASITLTGLSGGLYIRGSANDGTTNAISVRNDLDSTAASARVSVLSATASGGIIAYPATFGSAALADFVGFFCETDAAGIISALAATTQTWRWNAGGGNIMNLSGASPAVLSLQDAFNITPGTTTGLKIGTTTTQKIGIWGNTPVVRPAAYTQTYATATRTHENPTAAALSMADGAGTNDNTIGAITADASVIAAFQEIVDEVNKAVADIANVKQVLNQSIDDDQLVGWKA
jgi:hypothetical protein